MQLFRALANVAVVGVALTAWSACSSSSTSDAQPQGNPNCGQYIYVDPNECCPAHCTNGDTCSNQLYEGYQYDTCENGTWVVTRVEGPGDEDSGPTTRPDASAPDATHPGADGSTVDAAADADANVTADAPPDVASDALAD